jgi:hypothetical protein
MKIDNRTIEFKAIKRIWSVEYINSDNRISTCYHSNKKVLTNHLEFLKSRNCHDFKEFKHDYCLLDKEKYIYPIPQTEINHYKELLASEIQ